MGRLSLSIVFVVLFVTAAFAHQGSIGLYTADDAADCDYPAARFEQFDVHVLYMRSTSGPDGITALEFRIMRSSSVVNFVSATWRQGFVTLGDVEGGISIATGGCYGAGSPIAPIGTVKYFLLEPAPAGEYLRVVLSPLASEPTLHVATCEFGYPLHEVLGGWFLFVNNECNPGTESRSWGAIKALME